MSPQTARKERNPVMSQPTDRMTMARVSDVELVVEKKFRAPAHIVFDAYTKAEYVRRWWAPASRGVTMAQCDVDLRPGGTYRYVLARGPEESYAFYGRFVEIGRPDRLVYTQTFEPFPDLEALITVSFDESDGVTHFRSSEVYPSKEALDAAVASGMEDGARETFDQLDALVISLV
jgi:uncharacterized protein YndB with AHSA1/START domain